MGMVLWLPEADGELAEATRKQDLPNNRAGPYDRVDRRQAGGYASG
jgi:hypothetical protein